MEPTCCADDSFSDDFLIDRMFMNFGSHPGRVMEPSPSTSRFWASSRWKRFSRRFERLLVIEPQLVILATLTCGSCQRYNNGSSTRAQGWHRCRHDALLQLVIATQVRQLASMLQSVILVMRGSVLTATLAAVVLAAVMWLVARNFRASDVQLDAGTVPMLAS